ncbi:prolipoprotein diacylglyceryl transferase [Hyphobacterium marinum]|uniref:Phosphatidylglycerol--prolipoprotein diacylglyceryl transferase n=1 Tax=Hyphobacterium marinum TaxID=3116574 RepID=A0ABU7M1Y9_9PROT|nr:prolipoprotein diacylglyceryl transferase [Hyphobacterium sp. Y6023]MEE2567430.1 prolipoprotein diacylglyceryl transferase [Hyphobacterium sp. Y6023]
MMSCIPAFDLIDPIIFTIGPFEVFGRELQFDLRWYAVAYIAGLMIGWRYMIALARRPKLWTPHGGKERASPFNTEDVDDLLFWAAIGVIAGGRLGYVLFYQINAIWERPLWIVTGIVEGGMAFHGGLIGVGLALFFVSRARKLSLWNVADAAAVVAPIGLFFGRLANFINGELWGRAADVPWAMRFATDPAGLCRHPSQLYEAALEGLAIFAIVNIATWRFRSLARPGLNTGLFLLSYGLFRALLETVREPDSHMPEALQGYVTMGMLLSIPMIAVGAWLVHRALKTGSPARA